MYTTPLGAIQNDTQCYIYPAIATKDYEYSCPDCKGDLILKKGNINAHHFAHRASDSPCNYYDKPSEAQIHKDAKMLLKMLLERKQSLTITTTHEMSCPNNNIPFEISEIDETSQIIMEYRFNYNGLKIADVAYIDDGDIVCIFEICNKHKTKEGGRPEPWFELDATDFINAVNSGNEIKCIRKRGVCDQCELVKCDICPELTPRWVYNTNSRKCASCHMHDPVYLNVPYNDKDEIKLLGGRFDATYKKWFITRDIMWGNKHITDRWPIWNPPTNT